jgi:hypothetical protein
MYLLTRKVEKEGNIHPLDTHKSKRWSWETQEMKGVLRSYWTEEHLYDQLGVSSVEEVDDYVYLISDTAFLQVIKTLLEQKHILILKYFLTEDEHEELNERPFYKTLSALQSDIRWIRDAKKVEQFFQSSLEMINYCFDTFDKVPFGIKLVFKGTALELYQDFSVFVSRNDSYENVKRFFKTIMSILGHDMHFFSGKDEAIVMEKMSKLKPLHHPRYLGFVSELMERAGMDAKEAVGLTDEEYAHIEKRMAELAKDLGREDVKNQQEARNQRFEEQKGNIRI